MRWFGRAAIVLQIIGWVDIALLFIGLPGSIDDTRTWARWVCFGSFSPYISCSHILCHLRATIVDIRVVVPKVT